MRTEWHALDRRIEALDAAFTTRAREDADARRLTTIPGIGVLNATALTAAIGTGETFVRGRDFAAWVGLVPRQMTTGGKPRLLGISKRGNKYLRSCSSTPRERRYQPWRAAPRRSDTGYAH